MLGTTAARINIFSVVRTSLYQYHTAHPRGRDSIVVLMSVMATLIELPEIVVTGVQKTGDV